MKKKAKKTTIKTPRVGQKIYVDSSFSISHGSTDVQGGIATVTSVDKGMSGGDPNVIFVEVAEHPGHSYNWTQFLGPDQAKLKKEFGKRKAYPDPDIDTPWIEEGDYVSTYDVRTGETTKGIHKGPPIW